MRRVAKKHDVVLVGIGKLQNVTTRLTYIQSDTALEAYTKNLRNALKNNYEIIHGFKNKWNNGGLSLLLSKLKKRSFFLDLDDYEAHSPYHKHTKFAHLKSHLYERIGKEVVKHSKKLTVASQALQKIFGGVLLPNSCELHEFDPEALESDDLTIRRRYGIGEDDFIVNWTSMMYDATNGELIINALKKISQKCRMRALFVGDGEKLLYYKALARHLNIEDRVIFTGYVPRSCVREIYSISDVGVLPFRNSLFNKCKSPIKLYEYMAMGVPIVATNVGQPARMVRKSDCGRVISADYIFLAKTLEEFYEMSREERINIGMRGRRYLERVQNWDILSKRLMSLYDEV